MPFSSGAIGADGKVKPPKPGFAPPFVPLRAPFIPNPYELFTQSLQNFGVADESDVDEAESKSSVAGPELRAAWL